MARSTPETTEAIPDEIAELTAEREGTTAKAGGKPERKPRQTAGKLVPRQAIESAVGLVNGVLGTISPADALTMGDDQPKFTIDLSNEFKMLVDGLEQQQKGSPRFRMWLGRFCLFSGGANLVGVVGLILWSRLQRHGIIQPLVQQQPEPEQNFTPAVTENGLAPDPFAPPPPPVWPVEA